MSRSTAFAKSNFSYLDSAVQHSRLGNEFNIYNIFFKDLVETQEANEELKEELDLHKKTSSLQFSHLKVC